MNYRRLGRAGVKVSEVSLGNWLTHGGGIADERAQQCIRRAVEHGINFFDTADIYRKGAAEEFLGPRLKEYRRQDIVLATKLFWPMSDNVNDRGLSRKHILEAVENSLRRLRTSYLDLYQCHRFDPEVEVGEVVRAMDDLIRQGKILYWGVSEWPAAEIRNACRIARETHACAPASEQPEYSIAARRVETNGVQQACEQEGLGMIVWSPLKQGLLTGKYAGGQVPPDSRAASPEMNQFIQNALAARGREIVDRVEKLRPIASEYGMTLAQLAIAWLLGRRGVSSVIIGASRPEQIDENVAAIGKTIGEADLKRIDELFPAAKFQ